MCQNGPKAVPKKGSFKTIEDGSKNDTSFKTMGENGQKSTSFKTMANRVKNLNPHYMAPVDEVSQVISDPQTRKKAQPVTEQLSSGPPPPGSRFNPIYVEPGSVSINSTRDLQALFPTALTALETCRASMTSRQTQLSHQSSTEGGKFPSSTRRRLRRS